MRALRFWRLCTQEQVLLDLDQLLQGRTRHAPRPLASSRRLCCPGRPRLQRSPPCCRRAARCPWTEQTLWPAGLGVGWAGAQGCGLGKQSACRLAGVNTRRRAQASRPSGQAAAWRRHACTYVPPSAWPPPGTCPPASACAAGRCRWPATHPGRRCQRRRTGRKAAPPTRRAARTPARSGGRAGGQGRTCVGTGSVGSRPWSPVCCGSSAPAARGGTGMALPRRTSGVRWNETSRCFSAGQEYLWLLLSTQPCGMTGGAGDTVEHASDQPSQLLTALAHRVTMPRPWLLAAGTSFSSLGPAKPRLMYPAPQRPSPVLPMPDSAAPQPPDCPASRARTWSQYSRSPRRLSLCSYAWNSCSNTWLEPYCGAQGGARRGTAGVLSAEAASNSSAAHSACRCYVPRL